MLEKHLLRLVWPAIMLFVFPIRLRLQGYPSSITNSRCLFNWFSDSKSKKKYKMSEILYFNVLLSTLIVALVYNIANVGTYFSTKRPYANNLMKLREIMVSGAA